MFKLNKVMNYCTIPNGRSIFYNMTKTTPIRPFETNDPLLQKLTCNPSNDKPKCVEKLKKSK